MPRSGLMKIKDRGWGNPRRVVLFNAPWRFALRLGQNIYTVRYKDERETGNRAG